MKNDRDYMALINTGHLFAQNKTHTVEKPSYGISVTTMNDNRLKGLLLQLKDTSIKLYPGNFTEWKTGINYLPEN